MAFIKVAKASGVPAGVVLGYEAGGIKIAIANVDRKLHAFEDHCTHRGGQLSRGLLLGGIIQCPLHGSQFEVASGQRVSGPAREPIRTFPVKVEGDDILVDL